MNIIPIDLDVNRVSIIQNMASHIQQVQSVNIFTVWIIKYIYVRLAYV